jgi:hypothetical protein
MPGRPRRDLGDRLPSYFCATAVGPQGGCHFKRGHRGVEAVIRFSDLNLPVVETQAYLDPLGVPSIRIRARQFGSQFERVFYDGPLAQVLERGFSEAPATRSLDAAEDYDCLDCLDVGWAIFNARPEDDYLGEIQACDCGLSSEEEALEAARTAGLSVDDRYQVLFVP